MKFDPPLFEREFFLKIYISVKKKPINQKASVVGKHFIMCRFNNNSDRDPLNNKILHTLVCKTIKN